MIYRLPDETFHNPIRSHIKITFHKCKEEERCTYIREHLELKKFSLEKSRVIVFINSRKAAEEKSQLFNEELPKAHPWKGKIGFFHAGMSSEDRNTNYKDYKEGNIAVLFSTKAFGMGMDIPNIHFVFHYAPSSTFEDYLQEVGRSGRNKELLNNAGFSEENPIETVCLYTQEDFGRAKDRLQKSSLKWTNILDTQTALNDFIKKSKRKEGESIPVPFDLLQQRMEKKIEKGDMMTLFQLGLYWLEKLKRISLGFYTPSYFEFDVTTTKKTDLETIAGVSDEKVRALLKFIYQETIGIEEDSNTLLVASSEVSKLLGTFKLVEIFRYFIIAENTGLVKIDRDLILQPVGKRKKEIDWLCKDESHKAPTLEFAYDVAQEVVSSVKSGKTGEFTPVDIESLLKKKTEEKNPFGIAKMQWIDSTEKRKENGLKLWESFKRQRIKHVFRSLLKISDKLTHTAVMEEKNVIQLVRNKGIDYGDYIHLTLDFKQQAYSLLRVVNKQFKEDALIKFPIIDLMNKVGIDSVERLEHLLVWLRNMGYQHWKGSILPMGIEVNLKDDSPINKEDLQGDDYAGYLDFLESQKLRKLRLAVLETIAVKIYNPHSQVKLNEFIEHYFKCKDSSEVIDLLENELGSSHSVITELKDEALEQAAEELNDEQKKVYIAPPRRNINVVAGPGSGKTHTLVLRVARLIHEEKIDPSEILVLAYNRAVVTELKDRLNRLFRRLGYYNLHKSLNVFTFHGFIKRCLGERLKEVQFEEWENKFIEIYDSRPGEIINIVGRFKYVLVDEFQDITLRRLEVLKRIAPPQRVYLTVIGDPNQSIYGYERAAAGGEISPNACYEAFDSTYNPELLFLNKNYRSFQEIIDVANQQLSPNPLFDIPALKCINTPEKRPLIVEDLENEPGLWEQKLIDLLNEKTTYGESYRQIALMFRTGKEVYRALAILKKSFHFPYYITIRIQGGSTNFNRIREVHYFWKEYEECAQKTPDKVVPLDLAQTLANRMNSENFYDAWDKNILYVLQALLLEFKKIREAKATYTDLIEFLNDFTRKDDGQLNKVFQLHQTEIEKLNDIIISTEIILTTIHRVKGLEYDAVLIPPSFADLPLVQKGDATEESIKEELDEERRLTYVAFTRAKYRLVRIKWEREKALISSNPYVLPHSFKTKLGYPEETRIDKFYISYLGRTQNDSKHDFLDTKVPTGVAVIIKRVHGHWLVTYKDEIIGRMRGSFMSNYADGTRIEGYVLQRVIRYTAKECQDFDAIDGTNFYNYWSPAAKKRGFVSIPDFAGYGQVIIP